MCGCMLADLGADVIKVEASGGEVSRHVVPFLPGTNPPISFMHASVNRNKRSVTLDLRRPEGRDLFLRLAARADVIVENFRPGVMHHFGIGYDEVRKVKPNVVYVSISGYGHFGPDRARAGYNVLSQARSGFISLNSETQGLAGQSADLSRRRSERTPRGARRAGGHPPSRPHRRGPARERRAARFGAVSIQRVPDAGGNGREARASRQRVSVRGAGQRLPMS